MGVVYFSGMRDNNPNNTTPRENMPTITVSKEETKEAIYQFKYDMTDGDCSVDITETKWNALTEAVSLWVYWFII